MPRQFDRKAKKRRSGISSFKDDLVEEPKPKKLKPSLPEPVEIIEAEVTVEPSEWPVLDPDTKAYCTHDIALNKHCMIRNKGYN